ncbi:MAG: LamG domain-containing protein [Candidatus Micrarchaeota archaeon]|nr:LamG domain-containing protein [Candidatus Micrarchaeota archaeon]
MDMEGLGARIKSQSAMEYLMTYGWAILAIAIVMVSLYSIGIFNLGNLKPTATPGSCQVVRTAAQTSLAGQCNNLIPKYVGQFGGTSYIKTGTVGLPLGNNQRSISMWVYPKSANNGAFYTYGTYASQEMVGLLITSAGSSLYFQVYGTDWDTGMSLNLNSWNFVAVAYNPTGNTVTAYVNGNTQTHSLGSALNTALPGSDPSDVGKIMNGQGQYAIGYIANIQVYNASLDNTTIKAIYKEGIGGAPIAVQYLVAWWPLNGNANDYSGNNNQGNATNMVWNANWQSGYTQPTS